MTAKELERYILSKQDVKKRVIYEWRSVRYTIYSVAIATVFEHNGEPVITVFGRNKDYEVEYPDIIVPAIDNEPEHFSTVFFTRGVSDAAIKDMIDRSCFLRLKQMVRPRSANTGGAERIPYCGIVSGYYVQDGIIKARKSCAPDEVFAALDLQNDERYSASVKKEHISLEGIGSMNSVPYSVSVTRQQLHDFFHMRQDLRSESETTSGTMQDDKIDR